MLRYFFHQLAFHRIARDIGSEELIFRDVIGVRGAFGAARDFTRRCAKIKQEPIRRGAEARAAWKAIGAKALKLNAIVQPDA